MPDDFGEGIHALISPGVGGTSEFELFFADLGIDSYLYDGSLEAPPIENPHFHFKKMNLGMFPSPSDVTLEDTVMESSRAGEDLILQMDIEGGEWTVLASTAPAVLRSFRIMVIEFHDLSAWIGRRTSLPLATQIFEKLLDDFYVVHVSINNCCGSARVRTQTVPRVIEVTFLRKDRVRPRNSDVFATLPHPLDSKNIVNRPLALVPRQWQ